MALGPLLKDKISLITGAGAGIGAESARLFASEGATVVVADIKGDTAEAVAEEIKAAGGKAIAIAIDVRDDAQVAAMRDKVLAEYGRLDVLINNVGYWVNLPPSFMESTPEHWQALYEVNLRHVFSVTHAFLPAMVAAKTGSIVNVSSIEGLRGYPQDSAYGAFKAAVVHFTTCLGVELGPKGIRVNGVGPDLTNSEQSNFKAWDPPEFADKWNIWSPVGRLAEPIDQAKAILFLASDMAGWITGHTLPTDGGTAAAAGWYQTKHRKGRVWTNRPIDP